MKMSGKFITFEGGEGVGKSTQVQLLANELRRRGFKVQITREPGGDEVGEKIRTVLKSASSKMDPLCETFLLFAARRDHFVNVIAPLLELGYFVICDRFYDSTLVYQGLLKHVSIEDIMKLKQICVGNFEPDLTIVLDMDVESAINRVATRNFVLDDPVLDEYDAMDKEKYNVIREGFHKIADIFSFRTEMVKANGSKEAVFERIFKKIENRLLKNS